MKVEKRRSVLVVLAAIGLTGVFSFLNSEAVLSSKTANFVIVTADADSVLQTREHTRAVSVLEFDGFENHYVEVSNSPELTPGTSNFSISAWVKFLGEVDGEHRHDYVIYGNSSHRHTSGVDGAHVLLIRQRNSLAYEADNREINLRTGAVPEKRWIHVAIVRDGNTFTMYRNGVNVGAAIGEPDVSTDRNIQIGSSPASRTNFNGYLSDIRHFDKALSADEIQQLYDGKDVSDDLAGHWKLNEGEGKTAYDSSDNDNNGRIENATWKTYTVPR